MPPLRLDFHAAHPVRPLAWMLLAAGLAILAGLAAIHLAWEREAQILRLTIQHAESRRPQPESARRDPAAEAARTAAQTAVDKARLPWADLFRTLEAADNRDVAVLSVLSNGVRGEVRIHGEARNLAAMVAYQRRLEQDGSFRRVTLADHESTGETAADPVRFHLSASWGEDHGNP